MLSKKDKGFKGLRPLWVPVGSCYQLVVDDDDCGDAVLVEDDNCGDAVLVEDDNCGDTMLVEYVTCVPWDVTRTISTGVPTGTFVGPVQLNVAIAEPPGGIGEEER